MAWTLQQVTQFQDVSATFTYYFAPNELVYVGRYNASKNQVVQEAESGIIKVLDLSDDETELFEFRPNRLPQDNRTDGLLLRGASSLDLWIRTVCNYRGNAFDLWIPGAVKTNPATARVRYWGGTFRLDRVDGNGTERYGNGSQSILFRKEIT